MPQHQAHKHTHLNKIRLGSISRGLRPILAHYQSERGRESHQSCECGWEKERWEGEMHMDGRKDWGIIRERAREREKTSGREGWRTHTHTHCTPSKWWLQFPTCCWFTTQHTNTMAAQECSINSNKMANVYQLSLKSNGPSVMPYEIIYHHWLLLTHWKEVKFKGVQWLSNESSILEGVQAENVSDQGPPGPIDQWV